MRAGTVWLVAALAALGAGCASLNYAPRVVAVGTGAYRDTRVLDAAAATVPPADAARVKVYTAGLPDGMRAENGRLVVDHARYEELGRVGVTVAAPGLTNVGWWFYDYAADESWRKAYCWWQVPLGWLTGGIWALLPPYYPCWVLPRNDPGGRQARIVQAVQRAARALGADLVVMGTRYAFGDGSWLLGGNEGTAFRIRPAAPAPAPAAPGPAPSSPPGPPGDRS